MRRFILAVLVLLTATSAVFAAPRRPNIIYILADDLGYAELGCYGQTKIRTPNIDKLAAEGMRFTQHYSGSPVCAPSRCTLLTGLHTGHAYVRNNYEVGGWGPEEPEGQLPLTEETVTLAMLLQEQGYVTCAVGKWGLGGPDTSGHPNLQGFDHFYGHLCQRVAHNHYPTHLWRNGEKDVLEGNNYFSAHQRLEEAPKDAAAYKKYSSTHYAGDLILEEALQFIRDNRKQPFFLYYATPVPHVAIQVPDDSLKPYLELGWDEEPYLGWQGYLPHPAPRAGYAAMVSRFDRDVGRIMALLKETGLEEDTLVILSSDNGPTFNGGSDSEFFQSAGPLRGLKAQLYEGGIRVPMIARWPGRIKPDSTSDHISAFWDVLPTIAEIVGFEPPADIDGISMVPTLLGRSGKQQEHEYLYWEFGESQALRMGRWKAVKPRNKNKIELYDLEEDIGEQTDLARQRSGLARRMYDFMWSVRTESRHFPLEKWEPDLEWEER